ncbi:hypothetical protein GCK72_000419 [Caenorhabditis remanei]|uniref:Uncharacterized protein n=1 Tax=Caenorhabditis remanei TaxID=31234 RepID=A0A6A5HQM2_CAERE|nr:hypothetical protein GCK72_000419 [Caenorhabditis remanei]KAF1768607.1 hypothetical protein GCK72_000419 [Caenorhabditis remanei]
MKRSAVKLKRKESDEWLCSSTYQPNRQEIIQKSVETPKPKKKLNIVVPKPKKSIKFENFEKNRFSASRSTPNLNFTIDDDQDDVDILNFVSTSEAVRTPMARVKIISPAIPKDSVRKSLSPPVVPQIRQSPEQLFAALTPKRRPSFEVTEQVVKRRKEDSEEIQNSAEDVVTTESGRISPGESLEIQNPAEDVTDSESDVSNIFDTMSPVKLPPEESPPQTTNYKFSLDFITGFEAQFSRFEDTQPPEDVPSYRLETSESSESSQLINDLEEPMSIFEEESEEKKVIFEEKTVKKSIRFVEPSSAWRKENLIEESCGAHLQTTSVIREYAIETCGMTMAESSDLPAPDEETQKYLAAESCALLANTPLTDSQDDEIYERDELFGLSARFASLMSSKTSERRLLMSDVVFGTVPKEKLRKLDVSSHKR